MEVLLLLPILSVAFELLPTVFFGIGLLRMTIFFVTVELLPTVSAVEPPTAEAEVVMFPGLVAVVVGVTWVVGVEGGGRRLAARSAVTISMG